MSTDSMSQDLTRVRSAIYGLVELAESELISPACPDPPIGFHSKLKEDVKIARQFLSAIRPEPEAFFVSAVARKRPGRASRY